MKKTFLSLAIVLLFASFTVGCKPEKDNKVEDAMEEVTDGIEDAADKAGDAVEDAGDKIEEAADEIDN